MQMRNPVHWSAGAAAVVVVACVWAAFQPATVRFEPFESSVRVPSPTAPAHSPRAHAQDDPHSPPASPSPSSASESHSSFSASAPEERSWAEVLTSGAARVPFRQWPSEADVQLPSGLLSGRALVAEVVLAGAPVVLKQSPATRWRAVRLWDRQYLSARQPRLSNVVLVPDGTFVYTKSHALSPALAAKLKDWAFPHAAVPLPSGSAVAAAHGDGDGDLAFRPRLANMTTAEFFDLCDAPPHSPTPSASASRTDTDGSTSTSTSGQPSPPPAGFAYFSEELLACCPALAADLQPAPCVDVFRVNDPHQPRHSHAHSHSHASVPTMAIGLGPPLPGVAELRPVQDTDPALFLWMGKAGVATNAHWDDVHNFFVQISGRKRFLLFPPSATPLMYPYPKLHPSSRQSQINFSAPYGAYGPGLGTHSEPADGADSDACAGADSMYASPFPLLTPRAFLSHAAPRVAELGPGDVLYLPPRWYHHVTALTTSVSVSIWTPSSAEDASLQAEDVPLPFEPAWPLRKLSSAVASFLALVLRMSDDRSGVGPVGTPLQHRHAAMDDCAPTPANPLLSLLRLPHGRGGGGSEGRPEGAGSGGGGGGGGAVGARLHVLLLTRYSRWVAAAVRHEGAALRAGGDDPAAVSARLAARRRELSLFWRSAVPVCACDRPSGHWQEADREREGSEASEGSGGSEGGDGGEGGGLPAVPSLPWLDDALWETLRSRAHTVAGIYNSLRPGSCGSRAQYLAHYAEQIADLLLDARRSELDDAAARAPAPSGPSAPSAPSAPLTSWTVPAFLFALTQRCPC